MSRYLVVADQTLGGERLAEEIRARAAEGAVSVHLVVPASGADQEPGAEAGVAGGGPPSTVSLADPGTRETADTTDRAQQVAFNRMKEAAARFRELGVDDVDGQVGDPDPLEAIASAVETDGPFEEIIISTPPKSVSKWVSMDVASRADRRFDIPVVHVEEDPTAGDLE